MKMKPARRAVGEFLGTGFLVAAVVGSGIMGERLAGGNVAIAILANTAWAYKQPQRFLLFDRDAKFGADVVSAVRGMAHGLSQSVAERCCGALGGKLPMRLA
jgi:glycerol uptake facilitator-like aquaporin